MILSCIRTGRWRRVVYMAEAERIRRANRIVDYEIGVAG